MAGTISATTASLIAAVAGLAGTGVGAYESHDASINQAASQKANAEALTKQQQADANQANLTKQQAVLGAQGQAQSQTGGSLTDSGTAALTDLLAGYPGFQSGSSTGTGTTTSAATSTGTGVGSSGVSGDTASGANSANGLDIAALLAKLQNGSGSGNFGGGGLGSISGGNWQPQSSAPQGHFELSNPVL